MFQVSLKRKHAILKSGLFSYTPLGVSQIVSYYTPLHSMRFFILTKLTVQRGVVSYITLSAVIFVNISWNEEECNMIHT